MIVHTLTSNYAGFINVKDLKKIIPWRPEDILQISYNTDTEEIRVKNLSTQAMLESVKKVQFTTYKYFEVLNTWEQVTGNYVAPDISLEKMLRPVLITERSGELKKLIKDEGIRNIKALKNMTLKQFIQKNKFLDRCIERK